MATDRRSRAHRRQWLQALAPMAALVFPMWWLTYRQAYVFCRHCGCDVITCVHTQYGQR